jgi:hypothetical protein
MDTDPIASPQPVSMEGVESTAPSVDTVPEKKGKERVRSREVADRT